MQYSDFKKIVFDNVKDFNTVHIFECGQCFRWIKEKADDENDNPVYVGVAGSYAEIKLAGRTISTWARITER